MPLFFLWDCWCWIFCFGELLIRDSEMDELIHFQNGLHGFVLCSVANTFLQLRLVQTTSVQIVVSLWRVIASQDSGSYFAGRTRLTSLRCQCPHRIGLSF
ncbi:hypothetical protein BKA65DRAFT_250539 [Rhexocercosporidium sp. MPI-PUGE-AT-0058]|nr:hypothetical protein BKA65DRAFT_250539 [Rhexocercosporidium sp. MPI-PUGE-AT-0058]